MYANNVQVVMGADRKVPFYDCDVGLEFKPMIETERKLFTASWYETSESGKRCGCLLATTKIPRIILGRCFINLKKENSHIGLVFVRGVWRQVADTFGIYGAKTVIEVFWNLCDFSLITDRNVLCPLKMEKT